MNSTLRDDAAGDLITSPGCPSRIVRASRWLLLAISVTSLAACLGDTSTSPTGAATSAPSLSIAPSPGRVAQGETTTLQWSSNGATSCTASGGWSGTKPTSGTVAVSSLNATTSYTLTCTGPGGSTTKSTEVVVTGPAPAISLSASPTTVLAGSASILSWQVANAATCTASGGWSGAKPTNGNASTGALSTSTEFALTCEGPFGTATQVTTVTIGAGLPTVSLAVSPSTITAGQAATLTWHTSNAESCAASGGWSGSRPLSGSVSTGTLEAATSFTLTCSGPGGQATQSTSVSVNRAPPTVSFAANPSTVTKGGAATLSWSSSNASACSAYGAWFGAKSLSGTQSTGSLAATSTFVLTCTGVGGKASQSATVSVGAAPSAPTVNLSVGPSAITSGGSATLTWSSTHATSCTASGGWSGSKATSGTQSTGALTSKSTFTLTCTGSGGTASQSATVSVSTPAPTVTFTAAPSTVTTGNDATLTWSATNATACTATGGWYGAKAVSGTQTTAKLTASTQYGLTCTGPGGSASQTETVSVTTPAPSVTLTANPSTVRSGSASTLTWSSTDASTCTASGGWTGAEPTSGSARTVALSATTKFTLTCTGAGGSASQSATVSVSALPPTVTLSASPATVASGGSSTLTWSSTNASACTASGGWSGSVGISGSRSTGGLTKSTTYTLSCTGSAGSATQSTTVTVASTSAPVVSLKASPASVTSGGTSTLTWDATNATTCAASGSWSGSMATTGSKSTGSVTSARSYTLSCSGKGGSVSRTVTVTVTAPPNPSGGGLTITSGPTLAAATVGAPYSYTMTASGGSAPYTWSFVRSLPLTTAFLSVNEWVISKSGVITSLMNPTTDETATVVLEVKDSAGNTATGNFYIPVTGMQITTPMKLGINAVAVGSNYTASAPLATMAANNGSGNYSWSITSQSGGSNNWSITSGGGVYGNPTSVETDTLVIKATDTTTGATVSNNFYISVVTALTATRPSGNTGSGFFVRYGEIYDPAGNLFRMRGIDRAHYDQNPQPGFAKSGANAARMFMFVTSVPAATYASAAQSEHIAYGEVPIVTMSLFPDGTGTSGNNNPAELDAGVAWWVNNYSAFASLQNKIMINLANEWGSNSSAWASEVSSAVQKLRAAGWTCPIVIDAGGTTGQDVGSFINYSGQIFAADPQRNLIFSQHFYGLSQTYPPGSTVALAQNNFASMQRLKNTVGAAYIVGEFGPGYGLGPSPTDVTPGELTTIAEANGIGVIPWAWDDNDTGNGADNYWFAFTYHSYTYNQQSDLTIFGQDMVLNPYYGLSANSQLATF